MSKHKYSYDEQGRVVARIYAADPSHARSWRNERNEQGRVVSHIVSADPSHEDSWRGRCVGEVDGYHVILLDDGSIKIGCQRHTLAHWRYRWREIASAHGCYVSEDQATRLLSRAGQ